MFSKKTQEEKLVDDRNLNSMTIEPKDIIKNVAQTPPFQQNSVGASYSGQNISWKLNFYLISQIKEGAIWHVMTRDSDNSPWVYFDIDIEQYPQFKIIHQNEEIRVTGVIDKVSGHEINLRNITNITFPKLKDIETINSNDNKLFIIKPWYEKPFGIILIGILITVVGGGILFLLRWN